MAKYILITPNRANGKLSLDESYIKIIKNKGLLPIINGDFENAAEYISVISGIILSGGGDLGKNLISEPIHEKAADIDDERDIFEMELIKEAVRQKIPLLCICRGAQVLNSALGGSLCQHIDGHIQKKSRSLPSHSINIKKKSMLYNIIKENNIEVNSFHHQCIAESAPCLKISALSADGIPEAVEWSQEGYFCIGVQWHPEAMADISAKRLFESFISECINLGKNT